MAAEFLEVFAFIGSIFGIGQFALSNFPTNNPSSPHAMVTATKLLPLRNNCSNYSPPGPSPSRLRSELLFLDTGLQRAEGKS